MINGVSSNITISNNGMEVGNKWQMPAVPDLNESGNMRTFEAGSILTEEGQYALKCGVVVNSKYGYASQLDMVTRDYESALFHHDYSAAASQDVISDLNEKYRQLKEEIENNYSGAEKEDRLKELDENYDEVVYYNIIKPLQHNIQFEITANKLRQKIGSFYDKAKATEGTAGANKRYPGMSDWKAATDEIGTTLDNMKALFDELLETIKKSRDNDEAGKYADSILKSINSGMAGVEEKKNAFRSTLDEGKNDKLKELWDLIEQKTDIYKDYSKKYASDEEKYRSFLKESSQFSGIDSRIDELLKEIMGA